MLFFVKIPFRYGNEISMQNHVREEFSYVDYLSLRNRQCPQRGCVSASGEMSSFQMAESQKSEAELYLVTV